MGAPISTTHAAASSVVGAGISSGKGANWKVIREMVTAWVLTIPLAASLSYGMFWLTQLPIVLAWPVVGTVVVAFSIWVVWAMRNSVSASDIEAELPSDQELGEFDQDPTPRLKGHGPVQ